MVTLFVIWDEKGLPRLRDYWRAGRGASMGAHPTAFERLPGGRRSRQRVAGEGSSLGGSDAV
eukprot:13108773-Alexandrium_andersonii.AAC.1